MQPDALNAFDERLWDLGRSGNVASFLQAIDASQRSPQTQITVNVYLSDTPDFLARAIKRPWQPIIDTAAGQLALIADPLGSYVLGFWRTEQPGAWLLSSSLPLTDKRWASIDKLARTRRGGLSPFFLDHFDFLNLGSQLAHYGDVEVSRITARNVADQSSVVRAWKARPGSLRPNHDEAIAEVEREGASVRTLSLSLRNTISVHLRRVAGATFYSGNLEVFVGVVLGQLTQAASRRWNLIKGRERQLNEAPSRPVSLVLDDIRFGSDLPTAAVIGALQRMPDTNVAVLHRNPYLHVAVTDLQDGSNFDLFITSNDSIEIYSGYRASAAALGRLSQELADWCQAKEIREAPPAGRVTLDELFV